MAEGTIGSANEESVEEFRVFGEPFFMLVSPLVQRIDDSLTGRTRRGSLYMTSFCVMRIAPRQLELRPV